MPMAGAGRDLTTTVVTAPTGIILATAIGVIITTTATTTINDDNGSGAYELRYRSTAEKATAMSRDAIYALGILWVCVGLALLIAWLRTSS